jgi:hypothetical protein
MTDSTGELTYAPNNLLLNTATLSTQSVTTAAIRYVLSFKGTGSVALSGAYTGSLAGTGASNRVALAFTSTAASLTLTVTGTVTEAQLEAVTYETQPSLYVANTSAAYYGPRYDYDSSTVPATPRGLLIEEARANLLTYSEQFDNANWFKGNSSVTANAAIAPDGTQTADKFIDNTVNTTHTMGQFYTTASPGNYVLSFYAKAAERFRIYATISNQTTGGATVTFNLLTGTIGVIAANGGDFTNAAASITPVGNGWYRCVISGTKGSANTNATPTFILDNGSGASYLGDGVSGLFLWGAQLEVGSFPTSYIPTVAASVTRAADVSFSTSISSWYSTTASTAIVQYNIPYAYPAASFPVLNSFSDGTLSNTNKLFLIGSILNAAFQNSLVGSVNIGRINATPTFTAGQPNRAAMSYKINDRAVTANGTTPATAATSPYLGSTTRLSIGTDEVGTSQINGWIQSFAYYNQRLPDAVLKTKSAVNAPY